ncbi:uncharacterized protein M421DRAFT_215518 [Didymella exigua CBS 183.55]|uniref:Uncharacterized protein n=1 Tax=Didymella exigua CBS 183.55 TaxID=1150837 RepID=A0A6A5RFY3_9PLEO|nr:uncharacterized protein M421DRAFT_215518 [Didymella exigua CBS 183.55]KAF1926389.1 hypothetical protein M421DRAFT_215518 [Didymella exigua CBS 183.55]
MQGSGRHCDWVAPGGRRRFGQARPRHMPGTRGGFLAIHSFDSLCTRTFYTVPSPPMIAATMTALVAGLPARPRPAQSDTLTPV